MADGYRIQTTLLIAGATAPRYVDYGTQVHIQALFYNSVGVLADPAVVKFSYRAPALAITTTYTYGTGSLLKSATGTYYVDLDTSESGGQWEWNFYSTGTGAAADHDTFFVRPSGV